jgi:hypothetical protein
MVPQAVREKIVALGEEGYRGTEILGKLDKSERPTKWVVNYILGKARRAGRPIPYFRGPNKVLRVLLPAGTLPAPLRARAENLRMTAYVSRALALAQSHPAPAGYQERSPGPDREEDAGL